MSQKEKKGNGLIHIYYGQGAGKTTNAIGLAIRAAGEGRRVDFVQFMKSGNSGEVTILETIADVHYRCAGEHPYIMSKGPAQIHYEHARKALRFAFAAIDRETDLLICDEVLDTILFKLLQKEQILDFMKRCKKKVELIMTGRDAPEEIIELADHAVELIQVKHPYYCGAIARKGIEY
ncbi:MAG: cob(I)yrinic acid a,c-diamide adenosyltransferase [Proteobacteria bacterium]|nr:cob(I)yrinic acid a,c-diamide adenosyltransferase [Pseudomonadota bacterium]